MCDFDSMSTVIEPIALFYVCYCIFVVQFKCNVSIPYLSFSQGIDLKIVDTSTKLLDMILITGMAWL